METRGASLISDQAIRIARVAPSTTAEGPGVRFAVWVQGCTIRCNGCFNAHLWGQSGGTLICPRDLAQQALESDVEGVTLLGGEPFEQAEGLSVFASLARVSGLSVMTFTGRNLSDLEQEAGSRPAVRRLIDATDLLVDGPYVADHPDLVRPWVGSTNQHFHFLTDRYESLRDDLPSVVDRLEIHVAGDGTVSVNGWATVDQLEQLLADTGIASPKKGKPR
ncbi:MAG: 4Fe-4S single cluster domain-containing protein [Coriobacteriia bacterium]